MHLHQVILLGVLLSILLTVFGFGLQAGWDDVSYVVRRPATTLRCLLAMIVIMPLVALAMEQAFELPRAVEIALVALAISPVPPLLPRREGKAGGYAPFAIGLMVTAALLSVAFVPLAVALLGKFFNRPFHIGVGVVAMKALMTTAVPLLAGMAVRALAPGIALKLTKPAARVAAVLLVICGLAALGASLPAVWALLGDGTLAALTGFVCVGLLAGHLLGGSEPSDRIVLALSTACRHPAMALTIGAANFSNEHLLPVIALYLIVNTLVGAVYLAWQRRHVARAGALASVRAA